MSLPVLAGMVSTAIFAGSVLPMLVKAARTRDLTSYSLGNIVLANVGNAVHSVYVLHLPPGPIWALHAFYVSSSALMLFWYLRFRGETRCPRRRPPRDGSSVAGMGRITHAEPAGGWVLRPKQPARRAA